MPKITAISYVFSLLFYAMGYLKTLVIKNSVAGQVNTYDFTMNVSLATSYFVFAIVLAVIGSLFLYLKKSRDRGILKKNAKLRVQLRNSQYGFDLSRKIS
ncbi:hypothetical protein [Desulfosporosinus sp.]|uniref:hypothetical protein n=1 Tax=Desulfosporosinus sp. TaxID=157907 RepID=UPI0025C517FE|nr:hypothetical protein [Desulfosporosinus sp.]MBC2724194.1 hypothetical protein [Desulfosporosinus sp.]MBC2725164.1 hypothetical protein [Desulfosporosinus sp.]